MRDNIEPREAYPDINTRGVITSLLKEIQLISMQMETNVSKFYALDDATML